MALLSPLANPSNILLARIAGHHLALYSQVPGKSNTLQRFLGFLMGKCRIRVSEGSPDILCPCLWYFQLRITLRDKIGRDVKYTTKYSKCRSVSDHRHEAMKVHFLYYKIC